MAARAGVEPTTLRLKVIVSTKAPPHYAMELYKHRGIIKLIKDDDDSQLSSLSPSALNVFGTEPDRRLA